MLLTDRRRAFGRREEDHERDPWQGSLFAPDAPASPPAKPPGETPDPFAPAEPAGPADRTVPPADAAASPRAHGAAAPPDAAPPPADALAPGFAATDYDDLTAAEDYLDDAAELEPAHARGPASRSILTGPTLDDVMSRAWEGLRAEVPTPCPVCHTEIEPSAHGRCDACGSTLA